MDQSDFEVGSARGCAVLYSGPGSLQEPPNPFPPNEAGEHEGWRLWAARRYACLPWPGGDRIEWSPYPQRPFCDTGTGSGQRTHVSRSRSQEVGGVPVRGRVKGREEANIRPDAALRWARFVRIRPPSRPLSSLRDCRSPIASPASPPKSYAPAQLSVIRAS